MNKNDAIRAGMEEFLRDCETWKSNTRPPESIEAMLSSLEIVDHEARREEFQVTVGRHFVSPQAAAAVQAMVATGWESTVELERIAGIDHHAPDAAIVETETGGLRKAYNIYKLCLVGGVWLIASMQTFHAGREEKVEDPDLGVLGASLPAPVQATTFPEGLSDLFDGPARVRTSWGVVATRVTSVGEIAAPSGFLAGDDPGRWECGAEVFEMRIPPGRHRIDLVTEERTGTVTAARVVVGRSQKGVSIAFATRRSATNHAAPESHVIGVDGGIIGLADAGSLIRLSRREREALYQELASASLQMGNRGAAFVPLSGLAEAWSIRSGGGDGGYCAYWSLDTKGNPLALVFDFAELAMPLCETLRGSFQISKGVSRVDQRELESRGIEVQFGRDRRHQTLKVRSPISTRTKLCDPAGRTLFDSEGSGCSQCENETVYHLPRNWPERLSGVFEVQVHLGNRYEIVGVGDP